MKRFKVYIAGLLIAFGVVALVPATVSYAQSPLDQICADTGATDNDACKKKDENASTLIKDIINVLLFVIGAIAVVMIIWGGITFTISAGNAASVKRAKDTIMYAVVGLVVAFLAYAIVNWVIEIL